MVLERRLMAMNNLCGCRIFGAFRLATNMTISRQFPQVVTSVSYYTGSKINHSSKFNTGSRIWRKQLTRRDPQSSQVSRHLATVENPHGGSDGTVTATAQPIETLGNKITKLFGWLSGVNSKSSVLWRSAMTLYRSCVEDINFEDFYEACSMPDTFQSWFMVNQLHIWMCLVRLKAEGKDGQYMYRKLVEIMWQDVEARMKKMGEIDSKTVRESLQELVQEFYGLIFAYDEGLLSCDRVLAAALWRNMIYDKRNTDASELANLVEYVRRQIQHLDNQDTGELLTTGQVLWLPFRKSKDQEPFLYRSYAK